MLLRQLSVASLSRPSAAVPRPGRTAPVQAAHSALVELPSRCRGLQHRRRVGVAPCRCEQRRKLCRCVSLLRAATPHHDHHVKLCSRSVPALHITGNINHREDTYTNPTTPSRRFSQPRPAGGASGENAAGKSLDGAICARAPGHQ